MARTKSTVAKKANKIVKKLNTVSSTDWIAIYVNSPPSPKYKIADANGEIRM